MSSSVTLPAALHPALLVVEGIDGSGKSTQAHRLAAWLQAAGHEVLLTREPGGTALAERLRDIILDATIRASARAELLMILAARAQHVAEVISPALERGIVVISDRFSLSSLAYQGFGRGLPLDDIRTADAVARAGIVPALTIWLDVPLQHALARIGERADRFEGEGREFLQRVIEGYGTLASNDDTIRRIDGTGTPEDVEEAIHRLLVQHSILRGDHQ